MKSFLLVATSVVLLAVPAQGAQKYLRDSKEFQEIEEAIAETYSEGNGIYHVYENPKDLSPTHLKQCGPSSVEAAVKWVAKEFTVWEDSIGKRKVKKALADLEEALGKGPIERCYSKEIDPSDPDQTPVHNTSYRNTKTKYRVHFEIMNTNV